MKFLNHNLFTGDITVNGTTTLSTATGITRTTGDNSTHLATTAFVKAQDYATNTSLGNYVPVSRTLTINGVTFDLSANRAWTIATSDYTSTLKHVVKAGVAITKGQAVYVTSADGTNMIVGLASNTTEATSSKTMGLIDTTVAANGFTSVITEGLLAGLNTSAAETAGEPVWLGVNGNLIFGLANKPYAPAHLVFIGIVTRVNQNNGEIFVKVQNGFELKEIHDVDLITTAPINGHLLGYNGTLWVNKTIAGWLGYTPANASGTTNYLSKFTGSTTLGNSLVYDNGTNVGIGTTDPTSQMSGTFGIGIYNALYPAVGFKNSTTAWLWYGQNSTFKMWNATAGDILTANTSGNIGIGTTSPAYKLDVSGTGRFTGAVTVGSRLALQPSYFGYSSSYKTLLIGSAGTDYTTNAVSLAFNVDITGNPSGAFNGSGQEYIWRNAGVFITPNAANTTYNTLFSWNSSGQLTFNQATTLSSSLTVERIQINSTTYEPLAINSSYGQVGLKFGLNGTYFAAIGSATNVTGAYAGSETDLGLGTSGSATANITFATGAGYLRRVTITAAGNVGIDTTAPTNKLQIGSVGSSGYGGNDIVIGNGTQVMAFYQSSTISTWYTNTNFALLASGGGSTGNLGIGTSSPGYKLDVQGSAGNITINTNGALSAGGQFISGTGEFASSSSGTDLNFRAGVTHLMVLKTSGNVGIGTTSPSNKLQVANGDMSITTGYSFILADTDTNWRLGRNIIVENGNQLTANTMQFIAANAANEGWQFVDDDGNTRFEIGASTGNAWLPSGNLYLNGNLAATQSWVTSQGYLTSLPSHNHDDRYYTETESDARYPLSRGTLGTTTNIGDATGFGNNLASGTYTRNYVGHSGQVWVSHDTGGSTGNFALEVTYYGAMYVHTNVDSSSWVTKQIWTSDTFANNSSNWNTAFGWGNHASAGYLTTLPAHNHDDRYYTETESDSRYVNTSGDTMTGALTIQGGWASTILDGDNVVLRKPNYSSGGWARTLLNFQEYDTTSLFQIGGYGSNNTMIYGYLGSAYNTPTFRWYANKNVVFDGKVGIGTTSPSEAFHVLGRGIFDGGSGNSSTDAVLYVTKSTNDDWGLYVNNVGLDYGIYARMSPSANYAIAIHNGTTWTTRITGNAVIYLGEKNAIEGNYDSWLRLNNSSQYASGVYTPGVMRADGGFNVSGSTVWHAGNDGTGSGLDADLLDGYQSSTLSTANTIALRDSVGDISAREFVLTASTIHTTTPSSIVGIFPTTNQVVKFADTAVRTFLNVPTRTGGDASGTWGISISGNAATATNLIGLGSIQSTSTGTSYQNNYQVRENSGGGGNTNEIYAPQLAFHWSGVVASSIMMEASGRMAIRNNPGGSYENFIAAVVYSSGYGDSTQWNTAYGWGNHASQGYATQTYVNTAISNLVDAAPATLDTLNELAAALGDDPNFATTVATSIGNKVAKAGDTMTGNLNWGATNLGLTWDMNTDGAYIKFFNTGNGDTDSRLEYGTSDDGNEYHRWVISNVERMNLKTAGLTVTGNVTCTGTFTETSSRRFKENIVDLEPTAEKVEKLRPVRYNKIDSEATEIGLIAEEVAELFPELVTYNEDGQPSGVQYQRLSVILLKTIQEQNVALAALTERINKLENK
jgi:hypothetical protein